MYRTFVSLLFYLPFLIIISIVLTCGQSLSQIIPFQIPSYDTNSHCLCVAGEVYCWWQNYNPSTAPSLGPSSLQSTTVESNYTPSLEASTNIADGFEASGDPAADPVPIGQQGHMEINVTSTTTTPSAPTTCLVMGT